MSIHTPQASPEWYPGHSSRGQAKGNAFPLRRRSPTGWQVSRDITAISVLLAPKSLLISEAGQYENKWQLFWVAVCSVHWMLPVVSHCECQQSNWYQHTTGFVELVKTKWLAQWSLPLFPEYLFLQRPGNECILVICVYVGAHMCYWGEPERAPH